MRTCNLERVGLLHTEASFRNENTNPNTTEEGSAEGDPKLKLGPLLPSNLSFSKGAIKGYGPESGLQMTEQRREPLTVLLPDQTSQPTSNNPTPLSDITCEPFMPSMLVFKA